MGEIIDLLISLIMRLFQVMESIEFLGTNLLKFSLTIMLIGIIIPLIYTIPNSQQQSAIVDGGYRINKKRQERNAARSMEKADSYYREKP